MTEQQQNARFALAVLFGISLMNFFDRQIAGALGEPIRVEFGLNDTQLGLVATVFTLVYAAVGVPLGRLTDNWLRTRLIAIGVTFWSVLTAAFALLFAAPCVFMALQQPKGGVVVFTILMGASSALSFAYYSTVYSAIQDVVARRDCTARYM